MPIYLIDVDRERLKQEQKVVPLEAYKEGSLAISSDAVRKIRHMGYTVGIIFPPIVNVYPPVKNEDILTIETELGVPLKFTEVEPSVLARYM